ncbi:MAG: hypothetical protein ACKOYQ_13115, partial [Actinomycetota bacterium]
PVSLLGLHRSPDAGHRPAGGSGTSIAITAGSRLAATFAGAALSLVAVVVLTPLYRHYTGGAPDTAAPNRSDADPAAAQ